MATSDFLDVLRLEARTLEECAERLRAPEASRELTALLEVCKSALDQGKKLIVTGMGKSGKVAQKISATLSSTGSLSVYLHPSEGLHGDLGVVSPGDVVLALSYSGNTEELLQLLPSLKVRGIRLIGIGGSRQSRLAEKCDYWIDASVKQEACPHGLAPTTSTTLALAIGDALAVALMKLRGIDAKTFAANHPGGTLGRRLTLHVRDLMHGAELTATATANATMDEIVMLSTQKPLGAVLIVDGEKLLGLITDGDLRRALGAREKFFSMKASDVMTRSPTTVTEDTLASEALALMENRKSQISVLPVVDSHGHWKGLLRLHDLARSL
jgi:arabinose-5-phosphate isomerase